MHINHVLMLFLKCKHLIFLTYNEPSNLQKDLQNNRYNLQKIYILEFPTVSFFLIPESDFIVKLLR